jgi:hypothetical protein
MMAGPPVAAQSPAPARLATPVLVRYEDPVGDMADGIGADIVEVTISQPDPASVSIVVEFAADPPLTYSSEEGWTDMLMLLGATGPEGVVPLPGEGQGVDADFITGLHGATLQASVEEGAPLVLDGSMDGNPVAVALEGSTVTLTLTRESLGDPERILFWMGTCREYVSGEGSTRGGDTFPDSPEDGPYTHVAWTFPAE